MATRVYAVSDIHVDYDANVQWVRQLSRSDHRDDILILAGDITHKPSQLASCLQELAVRFAKVLFVPGNHDVWVLGEPTQRTSLEKLDAVLALVEQNGASIQPHRHGEVLIAPLLSWYDYSFGEPSLELYSIWMDFHACRWPTGMGPKDIASDLMDRNEQLSGGEAARVITFSHFLPRIDLIPAYVSSRHRVLDPVLGSARLDEQLRRLGSSMHVYGHSHINRRIEIEGVTYINNALGYPGEERITGRQLLCIDEL